MYMLKIITTMLGLLNKEDKKKYIKLQLIFLLSALVQVVGIASIGPFIALVTDPSLIQNNPLLNAVYVTGGFTSDIDFIIFAALASLMLIILSNTVAATTLWLTFRFSVHLGSTLQGEVYRSGLCMDYIEHKTRNYNGLIATVSKQVPRFIYMVLQPFLLLNSQLMIAVAILTGLLILDFNIAIFTGLIIGGSYMVTYLYLKKSLVKHGGIVTQKNEAVQSILSESFIGIKEVKLGTLERQYMERFSSTNVKGLKSQAFASLAGEIPKFIIETISFGAILILSIVLISTRESASSVVPILSIYALAGYKLLPTMQQIYKAISSISAHGSVAMVVDEAVKRGRPKMSNAAPKLMDIQTVSIKEATFYYPNADRPAVYNANLEFHRGHIYSLVGPSGSGKSTLADMILGLLALNQGTLNVNGKELCSQQHSTYRNSLSYVSQNIFILDDTVVNNVAFGVAEQDIDLIRVNQALEQADAISFVKNLPNGVNTNLGQDGKLLSGGQRQRIGIARALYKQSNLLVLDEPTSALDLESEKKLIKTLARIKHSIIIIVISHRPASIKASDIVVLMNEGNITRVDSFSNTHEKDNKFRTMLSEV